MPDLPAQPPASTEAWADVLVSRTLRADSWWRAEPPGSRALVRSLWAAVLGRSIQHDLDHGARYVLHRTEDGRVFVGAACMAGDLRDINIRDHVNRPIPIMIGWLSESEPGHVPARAQLESNLRRWAAPVLAHWLDDVWAAPDGHLLRDPRPSPYQPPLWGDTGPKDVPPLEHPALDGHVWLYPAGTAMDDLWLSSAADSRPCTLITGWARHTMADLTLATHISAEDVVEPRSVPASDVRDVSTSSAMPSASPRDTFSDPDTALVLEPDTGHDEEPSPRRPVLTKLAGAGGFSGAGAGALLASQLDQTPQYISLALAGAVIGAALGGAVGTAIGGRRGGEQGGRIAQIGWDVIRSEARRTSRREPDPRAARAELPELPELPEPEGSPASPTLNRSLFGRRNPVHRDEEDLL
ncbi:hypothetical protein AB5L52_38915 [Streptomyces sp. CG4]|uniref:hypothetical protein n=1 Tax=Streptomyces sp. CG4 TaxID=408783 RepID=UPI0034E2773D